MLLRHRDSLDVDQSKTKGQLSLASMDNEFHTHIYVRGIAGLDGRYCTHTKPEGRGV